MSQLLQAVNNLHANNKGERSLPENKEPLK